MTAPPRAIRTPDQRLRVFVSSTLKELHPEREAARAAIEQLRLAPVMFELGARPHPPRELYRSYLAQSDIFVGVYGERYGWVAPGEEVSGLEDEYLLSDGLPSLIYLKDPAPAREARLDELLDRIRADDRTSYRSFATPEELAQLIQGDLATLLAERFDATAASPDPAAPEAPVAPPPPRAGVPAAYSTIVGREGERDAVLGMLADPSVRIVTLVGPGGIGKSRLAIDVAEAVADGGRNVGFALLESVTTPSKAIAPIARALGVRDAAGEGSLEDRVAAAIGDRDVLLVVDNMEHLLAAVDLLVRLVAEAPRLQLLVTSRSPLRLRAEHVFEVGPLALPPASASLDTAADASAVALFAQRAAAVQPDFRLTADNVRSVVEICRGLDGVPLAIELAAARLRSLSPAQILDRLGSALSLLTTGARDLPERQRALRDTVRWSVDLLDDPARAALGALSAFAGTFSLRSAEAVLAATGADDPLAALEALVDASLLTMQDAGGTTTFRLLSIVRAYGAELPDTESAETATVAWTSWYRALAKESQSGMRGEHQLERLAALDLESENLAAVARALIERGELDEAAAYLWSLYLYLWIGGYHGIARSWAITILDRAESTGLGAQTRAIALYYVDAIGFWHDSAVDAVPGITRCRDLFLEAGDEFGAALTRISLGLAQLARREPALIPSAVAELELSLQGFRTIDDAWGQAVALVTLGRVDLLSGAIPSALARFEESLALATASGERLGIVIAQNHRGWAHVLQGDLDAAAHDFSESLGASVAMGHDEGVAYGLEGFGGVLAARGDAVGAGRLLGAAQGLRRRRGALNPGAFAFYTIPMGLLRDAGLGDELDAGLAEGEDLPLAEVLTQVDR